MISDQFHIFYEEQKLWKKNKWLGVPCWKLPFDQMVMQNIIFETKPDWIIETGTGMGGSAAFYASILELMGNGLVITMDIERKFNKLDLPDKVSSRIIQLYGSSTNSIVRDKVFGYAQGSGSCLVFLDSWHSKDHVLEELEFYSPLVGVGKYVIVEDTHASAEGHPVQWAYNDEGAMGAVREFMKNNDQFIIDESQEHHLMSFNPNGFLRRVK